MNDLRANRWQLPDGVNELLPDDAWRVETLRRQVMDRAHHWGYELIMPPLIEYLDSLLTGTGEMLDLQTFKIIDQHNGRSLGVRADMTPQVARMDAHALRSELPSRFFYTGSVLRARTDGAGGSRTPLQFGAELFGHQGPESDAEIIQLMLDSMALAGLSHDDMLLDLGHVGVYRALIENFDIPIEIEKPLFESLIRGSQPEVAQLLNSVADKPGMSLFNEHMHALLSLSGRCDYVLASARERLHKAGSAVHDALDNLESIITKLQAAHPALQIHIDLAELRGYSYHTGILFTLYDNAGRVLAKGGRYDAIGEAFGTARPATGFSSDLINLALSHQPMVNEMRVASSGIWVDDPGGAGVHEHMVKLRAQGKRVVCALAGSKLTAQTCHCNQQLVLQDKQWRVVDL